MIRSFRGKFAQVILAERRAPKGFAADLLHVARRKLIQLNAAAALGDLAIPPGNRLEALKGDLRGGATPSGSMTSGELYSAGPIPAPKMSI
jgi:proteic killer suppression protein